MDTGQGRRLVLIRALEALVGTLVLGISFRPVTLVGHIDSQKTTVAITLDIGFKADIASGIVHTLTGKHRCHNQSRYRSSSEPLHKLLYRLHPKAEAKDGSRQPAADYENNHFHHATSVRGVMSAIRQAATPPPIPP